MDEINTYFYIKQGNQLPDLTGRFINEVTKQPVDLTGATLEFHMAHPVTGAVLITRAALIDGNPTLGRFRFQWQAGDTDRAPGTYYGEVVATFAGKPLTAPNRTNFRIQITKKLA